MGLWVYNLLYINILRQYNKHPQFEKGSEDKSGSFSRESVVFI